MSEGATVRASSSALSRSVSSYTRCSASSSGPPSPADHYPPRIDPAAPRVGEERLQQLGNPAAPRGGVEVPDGAAGEELLPAGDDVLQLAVSLAQQLAEALRRKRRDGDVCKWHRSGPVSGAREPTSAA